MTHAVHFVLVHFGVFNKITWMRLPVGHSHNGADRKFALLKSALESLNGAWTPWDLEAAILQGCKNADGGAKVLWQLRNYNLEAFLSECVDPKVCVSRPPEGRPPEVARGTVLLLRASFPLLPSSPPYLLPFLTPHLTCACALIAMCIHLSPTPLSFAGYKQRFRGYGSKRKTEAGAEEKTEASARLWVYEYYPDNPNLADHGHVRITYKFEIQGQATEQSPEFYPHVLSPSGAHAPECPHHHPLGLPYCP